MTYLDFLASNDKAEEDERRNGRSRNGDPPKELPELERQEEAVYERDGPQMNGVAKRDRRGQNAFKAG